MKKTSLCFAAVFAVLFGFFVASCSGGADSPNLTLYMQPSGGSSDSGGGTQSPTPTPTPPAEYNVTYVITNGSDDMTGESRSSGKYTAQSELTIPQKEGFVFKGWYSDQAQTQAVTSFAGLTGDVTLYGHWAGTLYTVVIEGIDGATLAEGSAAVAGFSTEDTTLSLPAYTKRFYDFAGLYLDSEFNGTAVTQIDKDSAEAGATLTLYAKWTLIEYNVTYVITNGSDDMTSELRTSGKYSGKSELTLPQKEGFQFKGWYLDSEQKQVAPNFSELTGDLVLYGHWAGTLYTVKIEGVDGATLAEGSVDVTAYTSEDMELSLPVYVRRYYNFEGLYLRNDFTGTAITKINRNSADLGSALTVYAKWTEKVYKVKYDLLFESGVTNPNTVTTISASNMPINLNEPTYFDHNYKFAGWYTEYRVGRYTNKISTLSIDNVLEGEEAITLYAKWTRYTEENQTDSVVISTSMETLAEDFESLSKVASRIMTFYLVVKDKRISSSDFMRAVESRNCFITGRDLFYFDFSAATEQFELPLSFFRFKWNNKWFGWNCFGVTLPECSSFVSIPEQVFEGCEGFLKVVIPTQITKVCKHAFKDCGDKINLYYNSTISDFRKVNIDDSAKNEILNGGLYVRNDDNNEWKKIRRVCFDGSSGVWKDNFANEEFFFESDVVTLPTSDNITKQGYDFGGWYESSLYEGGAVSSIPSKNNVVLYAKWIPRTNIAYIVKHWFENADDDEYTLAISTDKKRGTAGELTAATIRDPGENYTAQPIDQEIIAGDGSTVVNVYYKRKLVTYILSLEGGTLDCESGIVMRVGKKGQRVNINNPQRSDAVFLGWKTSSGILCNLPSIYENDATYTAVWSLNEVSIGITVDPLSDISVTKSQSGNILTFIAEDCDSYSWTLDGAAKGSARACSIDTSTLLNGTYTLILEAKKGGRWFSYAAQIKVN